MNTKLNLKTLAIVLLFALLTLLPASLSAQSSGVEAAETACPAPDTVVITEYTIPTENSNPWGITAGADGALWFGTAHGKNIGRITTEGEFTLFPFPLAHDGDQRFLAPGPDGAVWFTDDWQNKIGRITSDGSITEYPIPSGVPDTDDSGAAYITSLPRGLVTGADNALWFTEAYGNNIGRITVDGKITEYPIPTADSTPVGLALGSDGAVWFIEKTANQIGRITTDGEITEYAIPTPDSAALRITAGPDGALWFTEFNGNNIGRITTDGEFIEYPLPPGTGPVGITAGADTAIWFTEYNGNNIGCITTAGEITEYAIPTPASVPFSITIGSDGALWFTENGSSQIGRLQMQAAPVQTAARFTFSPETFKIPMSIRFGPDWQVAYDLRGKFAIGNQHDFGLSFYIVTAAKLADPIDRHLLPFPEDFLSWIESNPDFEVAKSIPVTVGGIEGVQIDATPIWKSTTTKFKLFLSLSGDITRNLHGQPDGENIVTDPEQWRFILLNNIDGERLFIILISANGDNFEDAVAKSQEILDSVVFTR